MSKTKFKVGDRVKCDLGRKGTVHSDDTFMGGKVPVVFDGNPDGTIVLVPGWAIRKLKPKKKPEQKEPRVIWIREHELNALAADPFGQESVIAALKPEVSNDIKFIEDIGQKTITREQLIKELLVYMSHSAAERACEEWGLA